MSRLLYQGVQGIPDQSEAIKAEIPSNSDGVAAPRRTRSADEDPKLKEECGVMAVYGHPEAARQHQGHGPGL